MSNMFDSGYSMELFKILENDVIEYLKYVPLDHEFYETHSKVCSPVLSDLLLRSCSQIETFFKEWICIEFNNGQDGEKTRKEIFDKNIEECIDCPNKLRQKTIKIIPLGKEITPFGNKDKKTPDWWTAYNKIKHDGFKERQRANLDNVISSLSGLFLLHCFNRTNTKKALLERHMTNVTGFGLNQIKHNLDKIRPNQLQIFRTPEYFGHSLFEYTWQD